MTMTAEGTGGCSGIANWMSINRANATWAIAIAATNTEREEIEGVTGT